MFSEPACEQKKRASDYVTWPTRDNSSGALASNFGSKRHPSCDVIVGLLAHCPLTSDQLHSPPTRFGPASSISAFYRHLSVNMGTLLALSRRCYSKSRPLSLRQPASTQRPTVGAPCISDSSPILTPTITKAAARTAGG